MNGVNKVLEDSKRPLAKKTDSNWIRGVFFSQELVFLQWKFYFKPVHLELINLSTIKFNSNATFQK